MSKDNHQTHNDNTFKSFRFQLKNIQAREGIVEKTQNRYING